MPYDDEKMSSECVWWFCVSISVCIAFAVILSVVAGLSYPEERKEAISYWKTTCRVIDCQLYDPNYDTVTFQATAYFNHTKSLEVKKGCIVHPINSTVECFVNAKGLRFKQPNGIDGLVCMIVAAICVVAAMIVGLVWIGKLGWCDACCTKCSCQQSNLTQTVKVQLRAISAAVPPTNPPPLQRTVVDGSSSSSTDDLTSTEIEASIDSNIPPQ